MCIFKTLLGVYSFWFYKTQNNCSKTRKRKSIKSIQVSQVQRKLGLSCPQRLLRSLRVITIVLLPLPSSLHWVCHLDLHIHQTKLGEPSRKQPHRQKMSGKGFQSDFVHPWRILSVLLFLASSSFYALWVGLCSLMQSPGALHSLDQISRGSLLFLDEPTATEHTFSVPMRVVFTLCTDSVW